jgi:hypothetical protein
MHDAKKSVGFSKLCLHNMLRKEVCYYVEVSVRVRMRTYSIHTVADGQTYTEKTTYMNVNANKMIDVNNLKTDMKWQKRARIAYYFDIMPNILNSHH